MKTARRIVIVGGVAGGASAAARARRVDESAEIHIFERGPYISFANCGLPYHIAGEIDDRAKLLIMTPEKLWVRSRVQVHVNHEVLSIDRPARQSVSVSGRRLGRRFPLRQAHPEPGRKAYRPSDPRRRPAQRLHPARCPRHGSHHRFLDSRKPRTAAIIGGGFIGLEMAEAFHRRGMHVTVIEKLPQILPLLDRDMALHLQNRVRGNDFAIMTGAEAKSLQRRGRGTDRWHIRPADLILLSVGVRAEVELAKRAGLEIGVTGGVKVNARMESSDPDIYAVGDAAETTHMLTGARTRIPLAGPANRQGRIAGGNAAGGHFLYPGASEPQLSVFCT